MHGQMHVYVCGVVLRVPRRSLAFYLRCKDGAIVRRTCRTPCQRQLLTCLEGDLILNLSAGSRLSCSDQRGSALLELVCLRFDAFFAG